MRIDFDTYKEILDTITRNKTRSFLTGFGVFWGVFMLVFLIGGGNGTKELLNSNFAGFATNSGIIFAQATTKPYAGFRKGRKWMMTYDDVTRLKEQIPELDVVSPMLSNWGSKTIYGDKKADCVVKGLLPEYAKVSEPKIYYGRYLNDMDMAQHRKVCVLGKKIYKNLFANGENPLGKLVRIDSVYYSVVGVDYTTGGININGSSQESVIVPITVMQQAYNMGNDIHLISMTVKRGYSVSELTPRICRIIGKAHSVDPTDEKAITLLNTEEMFGLLDSLFTGVNFMIWLVGIGTLFAGSIGVSNIMMVTVKERTTEIGIRRAIGATPKVILSQIITESIMLTSVAGMSGIMFAVIILQMLEVGTTTDGILAAHFQIQFWTAIGAAILISILGVLAGLAPAFRAMSIKPVDAMRDE